MTGAGNAVVGTGRRRRVNRSVAVVSFLTLSLVGSIALSSCSGGSSSGLSTDQQAAQAWAQQNPQMWSWMQAHWDEMTQMYQHWGDSSWMRANLPDYAWMQAHWSGMSWMHEHWAGMSWMHSQGMMGSPSGGMMGG